MSVPALDRGSIPHKQVKSAETTVLPLIPPDEPGVSEVGIAVAAVAAGLDVTVADGTISVAGARLPATLTRLRRRGWVVRWQGDPKTFSRTPSGGRAAAVIASR